MERDLGGIYAADRRVICSFGNDTTYYPSEGEAPRVDDAHLIAAAPDMFEALTAIMGHFGPGTMDHELFLKGTQALAKARGETIPDFDPEDDHL
jgi:hypothetical protein